MNGRGSGVRKLLAAVYLCVVLVEAACQAGPAEEISSTKPYSDLIGARYTVVADYLDAYGVYESLNDRTLTFIELIPGRPGIAGPEIAFRRNIKKGQVVKIRSAWTHFVLSGSSVYYLVDLKNSDLPSGVPVRLPLSTGENKGIGADLNPVIYKRLQKDN
jgi:hypothetical protein